MYEYPENQSVSTSTNFKLVERMVELQVPLAHSPNRLLGPVNSKNPSTKN